MISQWFSKKSETTVFLTERDTKSLCNNLQIWFRSYFLLSLIKLDFQFLKKFCRRGFFIRDQSPIKNHRRQILKTRSNWFFFVLSTLIPLITIRLSIMIISNPFTVYSYSLICKCCFHVTVMSYGLDLTNNRLPNDNPLWEFCRTWYSAIRQQVMIKNSEMQVKKWNRFFRYEVHKYPLNWYCLITCTATNNRYHSRLDTI